MKPEQIYQDLKDLAEKLGINVTEHNFRKTGTKAKSGLCKVKDRHMFVMNKHETIDRKIELLASCLSKMPHEDIFVIPAVRDLITKFIKFT
ncbi:MAG: hypothetical protein JRF27_04875 [Deltaproteobacteria bacterium]|nr:hypothetical protein [Deltaproteobacteria bacterium]